MCLDLTKESKILTARRDITVVKWLVRTSGGQLKSPYKNCTWSRRELKTASRFTGDYGAPVHESLKRHTAINEGLHAYNVTRGRKECKDCPDALHYEAVIPKGTKYIRGKDGEVVSLALRLTGKRFKLEKK
jgi:hypothetical protein